MKSGTATLRERTAGSSTYAADLITGATVVAGMARSPYPHARITRIDTSAALAIPGVLAVLTPDDFPDLRLGQQRADEPVLTSVARHVGDGVAAVAASDPDALVRGIAALDIEYECLPHVLTAEEGLRAGIAVHDDCPDNVAFNFASERGEWAAICDQCEVWVEGTFDTEAVPHAYLEPRATFVRCRNNKLELVTGSHFPAVLAEHYRPIVEQWGAELDIVTPAMGGSFGAKWEHPSHLVCLAFAHRLKQDVGMVFSRREDMIAGRTRVGMRIHMRIGARKDGTLLAKETVVVADNGAYSAHGPSVTMAATIRMDNLYRFAAIKAEAKLVYTNNIPSECFRGFGSPQAAFAQEQLLDELAARLQMDSVELRLANCVQTGDTTIHGWQIGSCGMSDCLEQVSRRLDDFRSDDQDESSTRYRTGYGVAACIHVIGNRGYDKRFDKAAVRLTVDGSGSLLLHSTEVELGCGTVDVLKTVVARNLEIDERSVAVALGDTATAPYGLGSFASRTSFFDGRAALDACDKFRVACKDLLRELGEAEDCSVAATIDFAVRHGRTAGLDVTGEFEPTGVAVPDASGFGNVSPAYTFGAHACCVTIDRLTGKVTVRQYWAAHDAGEILSYNGAVGQVVGGIVQGLGFALAEVVAVDEDGRMLNPGYVDDRVATFADRVPIEVIFPPLRDTAGPNGAKTIAEPPLIPVAACVANAIQDALGKRQYRLPMTPERVWRSIAEQD